MSEVAEQTQKTDESLHQENCRNNPDSNRLLIFIVAYNAENTIENVLRRIPVSLSECYDIEVLIIDDSSKDSTFERSELAKRRGVIPFKMTVLFNPVNQGYGGNQKIGFHYAINHGFDYVALVHGDGQYAPECLPELVGALAKKQGDAVFGSRMMNGTAALKGGMPLYKFIGNKILTTFQNILLRCDLSEFHSGYRLYSISALEKIPFDLNSNDFHFDTEIIIQLLIAGLHIKELPIPTFYGDEICHVNGLKYAWDVCRTTLQARVQKYHIFFDRKFDCAPSDRGTKDELRTMTAPERAFLKIAPKGARVIVLGQASHEFISFLKTNYEVLVTRSSDVLEVANNDLKHADFLTIFDDTELSQRPIQLIEYLKKISSNKPDLVIALAVGNIGFIITRLMLLFGRFSYTRKGIINFSHFRFFTFRSLKTLFQQNGFQVLQIFGIPIDYKKISSSATLNHLLTGIHSLLIKMRKPLFSYQFLITVKSKPNLDYLLTSAMQIAAEKQNKIDEKND